VIGEQGLEVAHRVPGVGDAVEPEGTHAGHVGRLAGLALVDRGVVGELLGGHVDHHLAPVADHHAAGVGDHADLGPGQVPLVEDRLHLGLAPLVDDDEHALLRLREHDLVARHVRGPLRHLVQLDLDARAGARGRLAGGAGQARRAHVLHAGHAPGRQELEAGLADELLHEGIAHLHGPALLLGRLLGEVLRGEGRAGQAVTARRRPDVEHRVADPAGRTAGDLVVAQHAEGEGIDQGVALVALVEIDLARDGRDAEAVAVVGDAAHHAREQAAHLGVGQLAEPQRIECRHRPGTHGEDVADDAADPGRRALERLHRARVVVRLDLEGDGHAVAHVDDARVLLARPHEDLLALGREGLQHRPGVLVGAVLRPHHREDAQLGVRRLPPEDLEDLLVLVRREVVLRDQFRGDGRIVHRKGRRYGNGPGGQAREDPVRRPAEPAGPGRVGVRGPVGRGLRGGLGACHGAR